MSSQTQSAPDLEITPFNLDHDLPSISQIWLAALPKYPVSADTLAKLLPQDNAHHLIAKFGPELEPIGFCLSYTERKYRGTGPTGYIAVLAVHPDAQGRGVGTALLHQTISWHKTNLEPCHLEIGSSFPRFWPGVPVSMPKFVLDGDRDRTLDNGEETLSRALDFFTKRGFRMRPHLTRAVDLYRDIRSFSLSEGGIDYTAKAREAGITFEPLTEDGYAECMEGQRKNFGNNAAWVDMFSQIPPTHHPHSIMTAFSPTGTQIGWTLMLPPSSPILSSNWAMPSICGAQTGLIGCVGIDRTHRGKGIGLALVASAMQSMKERGVEEVFVDWVVIEGFYEKLGFEVWGTYRPWEYKDGNEIIV